MPCSTVALNFMSELDDLFKMDGGLDMLDKTVHQKYGLWQINTRLADAR
jgi:hypothetical protein